MVISKLVLVIINQIGPDFKEDTIIITITNYATTTRTVTVTIEVDAINMNFNENVSGFLAQ
jgi:hypothetical protein